MKYFHILSVGIVLATALCGPAKAVDLPTMEPSPLLVVEENPAEFTLQPVPPPYPMTYVMDKREQNLMLVHEIAAEVGHQEILQAMLLQETNGGLHPTCMSNPHSPPSQRSYGLMQVQIVAARSILQRYPTLMDDYYPGRELKRVSDREIVNMLMTNPVANIRIAAYHFNLYLNMVKGDVSRAIAAYNVGIGGVTKLKSPAHYKYVVQVKQKLNAVVKPFNQAYGLTTTAQPDTQVVIDR